MSANISIQNIIEFPDFPREILSRINPNQISIHAVGWGKWDNYIDINTGGVIGFGDYKQTFECIAPNGLIIYSTTIIIDSKSQSDALEELRNGL